MSFVDLFNDGLEELGIKPVKPNKGRELEEKGWKEWLLTLFPFWFEEQFSKEHEQYWELHWECLRQIKKGIEPDASIATKMLILGRGIGKSSTLECARIMRAAILKTGYSLIISETDDQAQEHLGNCRVLIEHPDSKLVEYYPYMEVGDGGDLMKGMPTADRKEMFITKSGYIFRSKGLSAKMRGLRVGTFRPSDLCHEYDTRIFTDGRWMKVQDHPTARLRTGDGYTVQIFGIPFTETVTPEHRYWVRSLPDLARPHWDRAVDGWMQAKDLHSRCYIGTPIDMSVELPPAIQINDTRSVSRRNDKGQIVSTATTDTFGVLSEFLDPDWWWLIGLWWGDGSLAKTRKKYASLVFTVADTTPHIAEKIYQIASKYNKKVTFGNRGQGCYQLQIAHKSIARWLANEWKKGNSMKLPPQWVERIDLECQKQLIRGYLDADGFVDVKNAEVRLTSVYLDGLLAVRRILARLNIPSSIRKGIDGTDNYVICGNKCKTRTKYDLRFRENASVLGYDNIPNSTRYKFNRNFIADGYQWSKIRSIDNATDRLFVPIDTPTREYLTDFGKSHNCFDDIDDVNDSLAVSANKLRLITASILPVQARKFVTIDFGQNLIGENSVVNQIYTGKTDAFANKTVIGVANAFETLNIDSGLDATGKLRHKILDTSVPSWQGLDVLRAQKFLDNSGLQTFMAEYQNEFSQFKSGKVIPEYNEDVQIITWSQFEKVFGQRRIPRHWKVGVGLDVGYSEGLYPHWSAWSFIATASVNSGMAGALFVYRSRTFKGTSIDDQATAILSDLYSDENGCYEKDEMIASWQMSHERTGEMMTLWEKYKLPFGKFRYYKAEDGVAQWRHLSRADKRQKHPFKEDRQNDDGTWVLGRPSMYYIVDDMQVITPQDDKGMKLLRDQVSAWEYVPVKLTETGQTQQKPSKVADDVPDSIKSIVCWFGNEPTPLTKEEEIMEAMPEVYKGELNEQGLVSRNLWLQQESLQTETDQQERFTF